MIVGLVMALIGIYLTIRLSPRCIGVPIGTIISIVGLIFICYKPNVFITIPVVMIVVSIMAVLYKRGLKDPEDSPDY